MKTIGEYLLSLTNQIKQSQVKKTLNHYVAC
jgi:hypothetical protein